MKELKKSVALFTTKNGTINPITGEIDGALSPAYLEKAFNDIGYNVTQYQIDETTIKDGKVIDLKTNSEINPDDFGMVISYTWSDNKQLESQALTIKKLFVDAGCYTDNSPESVEFGKDKIQGMLQMKAKGVSIPDTEVINADENISYKSAKKVVENIKGDKLVVKKSVSSGGYDVNFVNRDEAVELIVELNKQGQGLVVQELVPTKKPDGVNVEEGQTFSAYTRVIVIENPKTGRLEAVSAEEFINLEDYNPQFDTEDPSKTIERTLDLKEINPDILKESIKAVDALGLKVSGVDVTTSINPDGSDRIIIFEANDGMEISRPYNLEMNIPHLWAESQTLAYEKHVMMSKYNNQPNHNLEHLKNDNIDNERGGRY